MTDIVERLRAYSAEDWHSHPLRREAADEIVELRAEVEWLRARVSQLVNQLDDQYGTPCEQIRHQQEIARLRAALDDCIHGRKDWIERAKAALNDTTP